MKREKNRKGQIINIILGKELKLWVDNKADELGMSTAAYIRWLAIQAKRKEIK